MYRTVTQPSPIEQVTRRINWYLPDWLLHFNHTLLFAFDGEIPAFTLTSGYTVRLATTSDLEKLARAGMHGEIAQERFANGDTCVVVLRGEEVATFGWMASGRLFLGLGGLPFQSVANGQFMYDVVTLPHERQKGFMKSCYAFHMNHYRNTGTTVFHATIDVFNRGSIVSHLKFGFKAVGYSCCMTVFGVNIAWSKGWPGHKPPFSIYIRRPPRGIRAI